MKVTKLKVKEEHSVTLDTLFKDICVERYDYPELIILVKFALLITPSTANVERRFSVLSLLVTKQQNPLSPQSIDGLMQLVLLGPDDFEESTWEKLVVNYKEQKEQHIEL